MLERIQLRRTAGFKLAPNARSVARPHYYGNPYKVGDVYLVSSVLPFPVPSARTWEGPCGAGDLRAVRCPDVVTAVTWYADWAKLALEPAKVAMLKGLDLACWCPPPATGPDYCHARVLMCLSNGFTCKGFTNYQSGCPGHDWRTWRYAA